MKNKINRCIIGIVGIKQSGKDTIGKHLINNYGFTRYAFADPIKKACQDVFGFTYEQSWGSEKEVIDPFWGITPRIIFQKFGTELFQYELPKHVPELAKYGRTFWSQCFLKWYQQEKKKNPDLKVVITDVRFPFEADIIRSLGASIIKVERPMVVEQNDTHASEMEMENISCDYTFQNTTSIQNLETKLDIWLASNGQNN